MIDLKELKKQINQDWENALPDLRIFTNAKLYKILGPLIVGIELIKYPRTPEYAPYFVIYSLWGGRFGNDLETCLSGPIILEKYYNRKKMLFRIPFDKHSIFFPEAIESVLLQTPFPFDRDISTRELYNIIDDYSKTSVLKAAPFSYGQAALQEYKLKIAMYVGDNNEMGKILRNAQTYPWNEAQFKMVGIDKNLWLQSLHNSLNNRDTFLTIIKANRNNKKLKNLKISEIF